MPSSRLYGLRDGEMSYTDKLSHMNWPLVVLLMAIAAVGFAMLYSAGSGSAEPWAMRTTKATIQPSSDNTSYTSPRQAPTSMDNANTASTIQSRAVISALESIDRSGGLPARPLRP